MSGSLQQCTSQAVGEGLVPFVAPYSRQALRVERGMLVATTGERFPIVDGIPRFVRSEGYAAAFGLEWRTHSTIQLDSRNGLTISRDRLERCLGTTVASLRGRRVLEAGCGAGRFTELFVDAGAIVHAIDLSSAVEANKGNIGDRPNYVVAQADLECLPFAPEAFDVVVCLGVLQHTRSPDASVRALWHMVAPGGLLVIDHYAWALSLVTKLAPVYRLFVKRLPPASAKRVSDALVDACFPLHWAVRHVFPLQALLSRVSPCSVYFRAFPELTRNQQHELSRLDTFDQLTDHYKRLRTVGQIRRLLESLPAEDVWVQRGGNGVEARGRKAVRVSTDGMGRG